MKIRSTLTVAAILACVSAFASQADAQRRGRSIEGVRPEVHLDLGWYGAFGVGFRIDIPVVPDGFIDGVHDEFAISPGADLFFWSYAHTRYGHHHWEEDGVAFAPVVAAQWNFYLNEDWSLFPELGLVLQFYWHDHDNDDFDDGHTHVDPDPYIGFGARWHFNARNSLLMRLAWPAGAQIGITF